MVVFSWAQLTVLGLALDLAGVFVLSWSVFVIAPAQICAEEPATSRTASTWFDPELVLIPNPLERAKRRATQAAETKLGLPLVLVGFLLQAPSVVFSLGGLRTAD